MTRIRLPGKFLVYLLNISMTTAPYLTKKVPGPFAYCCEPLLMNWMQSVNMQSLELLHICYSPEVFCTLSSALLPIQSCKGHV